MPQADRCVVERYSTCSRGNRLERRAYAREREVNRVASKAESVGPLTGACEGIEAFWETDLVRAARMAAQDIAAYGQSRSPRASFRQFVIAATFWRTAERNAQMTADRVVVGVSYITG